jgi:hypothetical protein
VDALRGESGSRKDLGGVHDFVGDITATGAPAAAFDVVLLTEVLEHVPRPLEAPGPGGALRQLHFNLKV